MCSLEQFKIDLKALAEDVTPLEWQLDDQFFGLLEGAQLQHGSVHVSGSIRKAVGFYELLLHAEGNVQVPCDRCLEPMDQPIEADQRLVVKLGDTYTDDDDEVITVDEAHPVLDTAWLIYETVALAVPIQHVLQPGDCNDAMMRKLSELSAARSSDADATEAVDPRWAALLKLKGNS